MTVKDLAIDHYGSTGKSAIVKRIRTKVKYINNKRTNEQDGYAVDCVLPERSYNDLTVVVPAIPEELMQYSGNPIVCFEGLNLYVYGPQNDPKVGAKASSVHIVDGKSKT